MEVAKILISAKFAYRQGDLERITFNCPMCMTNHFIEVTERLLKETNVFPNIARVTLFNISFKHRCRGCEKHFMWSVPTNKYIRWNELSNINNT